MFSSSPTTGYRMTRSSPDLLVDFSLTVCDLGLLLREGLRSLKCAPLPPVSLGNDNMAYQNMDSLYLRTRLGRTLMGCMTCSYVSQGGAILNIIDTNTSRAKQSTSLNAYVYAS